MSASAGVTAIEHLPHPRNVVQQRWLADRTQAGEIDDPREEQIIQIGIDARPGSRS
jgi:hypothetical protein